VAFYFAKGFQLAGLLGGGFALWVGINGADMARELFLATFSLGLFYVGRRIES
jgi:hypothetical protein